jgi:RNA polymerase sigma-70 factor (ECF subfamily)
VREAVDALPSPQKTVLLLVYHEGLKYREAAATLGLPVGTVKSRLHAAIRSLTRSWQLQQMPAG